MAVLVLGAAGNTVSGDHAQKTQCPSLSPPPSLFVSLSLSVSLLLYLGAGGRRLGCVILFVMFALLAKESGTTHNTVMKARIARLENGRIHEFLVSERRVD